MVRYGKAVTKKDASGQAARWGVGIPGNVGSSQWLFGALVAQNGGKLFNENGTETYLTDPKVVEALQFWVDLSKKYGIHPPGIQEWGTTPSDFLEGRIAMIWTTTGNLTNIRKNAKFDFGVAPYPGKVAPASVLGRRQPLHVRESVAGREGRRVQVRQVPDLRRAAGRLGHPDRLRRAARRRVGDRRP